jgi:hypothetical protein
VSAQGWCWLLLWLDGLASHMYRKVWRSEAVAGVVLVWRRIHVNECIGNCHCCCHGLTCVFICVYQPYCRCPVDQ